MELEIPLTGRLVCISTSLTSILTLPSCEKPKGWSFHVHFLQYIPISESGLHIHLVKSSHQLYDSPELVLLRNQREGPLFVFYVVVVDVLFQS